MLKCYSYDIVCQEIPDEITLAVNISCCPNRCQGCHSPWLWGNEGEEMTEELPITLEEGIEYLNKHFAKVVVK